MLQAQSLRKRIKKLFSNSDHGKKVTLYAETVPLSEVAAPLVDQLYELYAGHYDHTDRDRFESDLSEKHWVILLRDIVGRQVVGFSTQMEMRVLVDSIPVRALFSGDTIIHPNYWGDQVLVRAWCRLAGGLKAQAKDELFYWFLISKGYRTYLYLPLFFKSFFPNYETPAPLFEQKLMWVLGDKKYPRLFNPINGLVEHGNIHDRLSPDLDKTLHRLSNPHVAFFVETNPLYQQGSELLCVAELSADNMRSIARREFESGLAEVKAVEIRV